MRAIGLMSGTSMDGIDVALIETDGEEVARFGPTAVHAYRDEDLALLRKAMEQAPAVRAREDRPGVLAKAEQLSTARHAEAVLDFIGANKIGRDSIDVVGFHGQ